MTQDKVPWICKIPLQGNGMAAFSKNCFFHCFFFVQFSSHCWWQEKSIRIKSFIIPIDFSVASSHLSKILNFKKISKSIFSSCESNLISRTIKNILTCLTFPVKINLPKKNLSKNLLKKLTEKRTNRDFFILPNTIKCCLVGDY